MKTIKYTLLLIIFAQLAAQICATEANLKTDSIKIKTEVAQSNDDFNKAYERLIGKTNDFFKIYFLSVITFIASFAVSDKQLQFFLRKLAIVEPFSRSIACSRLGTLFYTHIPFLGKHFMCSNKNCPGICNNCKLKLVFKEAPISLGLMFGINTLVKFLSDHNESHFLL